MHALSTSTGDDQRVPALGVRLHQHVNTVHRLQCRWGQCLFGRGKRVAAPLFQQQDTVTVTCCQVQVMQDHQHCSTAVGETAYGFQGGVLMQRVEHRGRFVEQQRAALLPGHSCASTGQVYRCRSPPESAR